MAIDWERLDYASARTARQIANIAYTLVVRPLFATGSASMLGMYDWSTVLGRVMCLMPCRSPRNKTCPLCDYGRRQRPCRNTQELGPWCAAATLRSLLRQPSATGRNHQDNNPVAALTDDWLDLAPAPAMGLADSWCDLISVLDGKSASVQSPCFEMFDTSC